MSATGGIKFCSWCNNMLYPKVKTEEEEVVDDDGNTMIVKKRRLKFSCRYDDYEEDADSPCVYQNKVQHAVDELSLIISDVVLDPTLPRTMDRPCPKCGNRHAVYFQAQINRESQGMQLYFVCSSCRHRWTSKDDEAAEDVTTLKEDDDVGDEEEQDELLDSGDGVLDAGDAGVSGTVVHDEDDMGLGDDDDDDDDLV